MLSGSGCLRGKYYVHSRLEMPRAALADRRCFTRRQDSAADDEYLVFELELGMIELVCAACGGPLRVGEDCAGKRVRCPKCNDIVYVPLEGRPGGAGDFGRWRLRLSSGEQYGPVPRAELDQWAAEGRVTPDCQLLCEGTNRWRWARELYPELADKPTVLQATATTARTLPPSQPLARRRSERSKIAAGLLGLFFGPLGIHRFYLGYPGIGLLMLATLGGCGIWSFIDTILIFCGAVRDGDGLVLRD
jgi:hypothetical protein